MDSTAPAPAVKVVGANGQITLGKHYAGRQVLVEQREPGVWIVRTATAIPDNERWLQWLGLRIIHPQTLIWSAPCFSKICSRCKKPNGMQP